jgi:hypothetical protein
MQVQCVRDLCQPSPVLDLFQQFRRGKKLDLFGGGLPSGLSSRAATSIGTSCGWQFSTHAACSAVRRAGNWFSSRKN